MSKNEKIIAAFLSALALTVVLGIQYLKYL